MRVSRFTQFGLVAIAALSTISVGLLGGGVFRDSATGETPTPIELIGQNLTQNDSSRPGALLRSLNLSRDQKAQLFSIRSQYQSDIRKTRKALRADMAQLRQLMISDAPKSEVEAQFSAVQNSRQALNKANFESYLQIREVLTLEQRQIFSDQLQARRQSRNRQRFLDQTQ